MKLRRLLTEPVFCLSAGLMGGDWPGIDGARGVNLC
jgi:hypothetical protein